MNPSFRRQSLLAVVTVCAVSALQSNRSFGHEDEAPAPQPPSSRRTVLTAEEMAAVLHDNLAGRPPEVRKINLPPLPEGVAELNFQEFFKMPVGPLGLEVSEKLRSLNGKRVRILGYMGQIERENKRQFIFAAMPLKPQPEEYGACDDIPAAHIVVTVPGNPDERIPHTPGALLLTGVLSVGPAEDDGKPSFVRMELDPPASPAAADRQ